MSVRDSEHCWWIFQSTVNPHKVHLRFCLSWTLWMSLEVKLQLQQQSRAAGGPQVRNGNPPLIKRNAIREHLKMSIFGGVQPVQHLTGCRDQLALAAWSPHTSITDPDFLDQPAHRQPENSLGIQQRAQLQRKRAGKEDVAWIRPSIPTAPKSNH